jgi:hypothetical protein
MVRALALAMFAAATVSAQQCGSGSSPGSTNAVPNFQTIAVNAGPANSYFDGAFTTVTICLPGQSSCQTIDGILVDTGSTGLRVLSDRLSLQLPQQNDPSGAPVVECAPFVDGFTWGPVRTADIKMAGEQASSVPVQVIGAPGFSVIPPSCSSNGAPEQTVDTLGANGILGVGVFRQDCGFACTVTGASNAGLYYSCPASGCRIVPEPLAQQLQNPVALFATDNNGVMIHLPTVAPGGAPAVSGMIVFGIGTQANNALGAAKVLTLDGDGNFTTTYASQSIGSTYVDSGSNGIFFLDSATTGLPICPVSTDFYCPATLQTLSATNRGVNGASSSVAFTVGNVDRLAATVTAAAEVAGPNPGGFAWGLPLFFGRSVFTAFEAASTPGGTGPYIAY